MSDKTDTQNKSASALPDTYLILLAIAVLAWAMTYLIPAGYFAGGNMQDFVYANADHEPSGLPLFASGDNPGLINFLFDGLVSGDRMSASVGLMAFILIAGGAFGIILKTGVIDQFLRNILSGGRIHSDILVPILFVGFSLCGAIFGMSEETIVFALIVIPALVRVGYDSITGLLITYVATQIGFATSWMNPFGVVIAQGIAGVPLLSGLEYRVVMWLVFTTVGAIYTTRYAMNIRRDPQRSLAYGSDQVFQEQDNNTQNEHITLGHWLILATVIFGVIWIAWGVTTQGYYLPEISAQFFAMGLIAGIVTVFFRLNNMNANDVMAAFREGAAQLVPAALVIGMAKGIVILLGGDNPETASVLNTILYNLSGLTEGWAAWASAWGMYVLQSVINLFVVSGSGQAALTMPLMAPLADLNGVSRQTAVLAFQLGDGLTNIFCPASAALMGCLGAARLDWTLWVKFCWKFLIGLMVLASAFIIISVLIGYM